jgi:lipoyl(octanoyl) transferase
VNKTPVNIVDCGVCEYGEMLDEQKKLLEQVHSGKAPNTVLLLEHKPVITTGARQSENKFVLGKEQIAAAGIELFAIRRGGGTTAHNPGQLVVYPIVDLRKTGLGINEFIRELEQIGIDALAATGVECERKKGLPGLWLGDKKIASIGVKVSMGITYHGMAINVCNDLSIFDAIIPCGIDGVVMTSAAEQDAKCTMEEFKKITTSVIQKRWGI